MATPRFVGVGYRKQQGKDTFADMLAKHLYRRGAIVHRASFAAALKEEVVAERPALARMVYGDESERNKMVTDGAGGTTTVRRLLQDVGMARREEDPDYWLNAVLNKYPTRRVPPRRPEFVVVSDVRFPNELAAMDHTFAVRRRGYLVPRDVHPSENSLTYASGWDAVVDNDAGLSCLDLNAEIVAKHLIEGTPLPF